MLTPSDRPTVPCSADVAAICSSLGIQSTEKLLEFVRQGCHALASVQDVCGCCTPGGMIFVDSCCLAAAFQQTGLVLSLFLTCFVLTSGQSESLQSDQKTSRFRHRQATSIASPRRMMWCLRHLCLIFWQLWCSTSRHFELD